MLLIQLAGVWEFPQTLCRGAGALDLVVVLLVVFVIIAVFYCTLFGIRHFKYVRHTLTPHGISVDQRRRHWAQVEWLVWGHTARTSARILLLSPFVPLFWVHFLTFPLWSYDKAAGQSSVLWRECGELPLRRHRTPDLSFRAEGNLTRSFASMAFKIFLACRIQCWRDILCRFTKGKSENKAAWLNGSNSTNDNNRWPCGAGAGSPPFTRADC